MLQALDIHKRFENVIALDGASVAIVPGELRALLGGNGSGKSTLAKAITGALRPDAGTIVVDDVNQRIRGPIDALAAGVAATYQELSLLQHLSVRENLLLHAAGHGSAAEHVVAEVLAELHVSSLLSAKVRDLPLAERHLVELGKALVTRPRFLILDELTSALRREQVDLVRGILDRLREEKVGVLVITHRLHEARELCSTVTVLRNGRVALAGAMADVDHAGLIDAMTGVEAKHDLEAERDRAKAAGAALPGGRTEVPRLELRLDGAGFVGYPGEIVGLAGLEGQGQSVLLRRLFGALPFAGLQAELDGRKLAIKGPRDAVAHGFAFLSGDREAEMAFRQRTTRENLLAAAWASRRPLDVDSSLTRLGLEHGQLDKPMRDLSGGTQQKVAVARWLGIEPSVVLADDLTRGVDVQTRLEIHTWLAELAAEGALVVFSSSDDAELSEICDRVYVMYGGHLVADLRGDDVDEHAIGRAALSAADTVRERPAASAARDAA